MSLPAAWVDRIFAKLAVTYGQRFMGLYAGLDPEAVKGEWGDTLAVFQQSPDAITYALDHLPADNPPNALQFREICKRRPDRQPLRLAQPEPDPEMKRQAIDALRHLAGCFRTAQADPRAWARRLQKREAAYEKLTPFQREAWRVALYEPAKTSAWEEERV